MKTIAFFTTSRAEFGIIRPLLKAIRSDEALEYLLFAGGSHLDSRHGNTFSEIAESGEKVTSLLNYLEPTYDLSAVGLGLSNLVCMVTKIFSSHNFDMVCIVGDRYEMLAVVSLAVIAKVPIVHLHGGERTEGAIDDQVRHMITKAAHLHFVICEEYANNVSAMEEEEWRIHNVGALAADGMREVNSREKIDVFQEYGFDSSRPKAILTYHPVSMEESIDPTQQVNNLFDALSRFDLSVIVTSPGVEVDTDKTLAATMARISGNENIKYVQSLGAERYFSALAHCDFVIGNSSSGVIEVPYFRKPTINIGSRQQGRFKHRSVIEANFSVESISSAIEKSLSPNFVESIVGMDYEFGRGDTASKIVRILRETKVDRKLLRKKIR